jgi:phosphoribosyl-dephospho-CoA transferase
VLPRHERVWLSAAGWASVRAQVADAYHPALAQWQRQNWPLIARRHEADCAPDLSCLGLPLPPREGDKVRLPLRIATNHITAHLPPLGLMELGTSLQTDWKNALDALRSAAHHKRVVFQVVGSAAMQAITGLPYVQSSSDIDLLLQPTSLEQLADGVDLLRQFANRLPLDGEVIFPSGDAVAWKEWCDTDQSSARVLVKSAARVALLQRDALLQTLCAQVAIS